MAKVEKKSVLICTDCEDEVYKCFGCGEYLQNKAEIICQEGRWGQIHYCIKCKK